MFIHIPYPSEVSLHLDAATAPGALGIQGPLGRVRLDLSALDPEGVCSLQWTPSSLALCVHPRHARIRGTVRALIAQGIHGVTQGWVVTLKVVGVGFRVEKEDTVLNVRLGQSHDVHFSIPSDVHILCSGNDIRVYGVDKGRVTQVAARLRGLKPLDAYKGKGIRYSDEELRLKEGKKK